jgi:hypothetical protein
VQQPPDQSDSLILFALLDLLVSWPGGLFAVAVRVAWIMLFLLHNVPNQDFRCFVHLLVGATWHHQHLIEPFVAVVQRVDGSIAILVELGEGSRRCVIETWAKFSSTLFWQLDLQSEKQHRM